MMTLLVRFVMALALVLGTWNPSGYSYVDWLSQILPDITAPVAFTGIVLLIGWVMFLHATLVSLGLLGIVLAAAFFGTLAWLLMDQGWLSSVNHVMTWLALILTAAVLTVGMSWSHLWRRLSGQVDVDVERD